MSCRARRQTPSRVWQRAGRSIDGALSYRASAAAVGDRRRTGPKRLRHGSLCRRRTWPRSVHASAPWSAKVYGPVKPRRSRWTRPPRRPASGRTTPTPGQQARWSARWSAKATRSPSRPPMGPLRRSQGDAHRLRRQAEGRQQEGLHRDRRQTPIHARRQSTRTASWVRKRALQARRFLSSQGIPLANMETVSWGEERLVSPARHAGGAGRQPARGPARPATDGGRRAGPPSAASGLAPRPSSGPHRISRAGDPKPCPPMAPPGGQVASQSSPGRSRAAGSSVWRRAPATAGRPLERPLCRRQARRVLGRHHPEANGRASRRPVISRATSAWSTPSRRRRQRRSVSAAGSRAATTTGPDLLADRCWRPTSTVTPSARTAKDLPVRGWWSLRRSISRSNKAKTDWL